MRLRKGMAALVPVVVLAMVAAACGGGDDDSGDDNSSGIKEGGEVIYGEGTAFPENLFPSIAAGNSTAIGYLEINILPAPYRVTPDFQVVRNKDLLTDEASSEVDGDKQTVTYKVNPDAEWSDGDPIDVKDFEFLWRTHRSTDPTDGGCAVILSTTGYDQIQSVEAGADDKEVVVTFSPPYADWQSLFTLYPQHLMDKGDAVENCKNFENGWPVADGIVGEASGGPWQLKKSGIDTTRKVFVLTPNENYYGTKPHLARLIHQTIGNEPNTVVQAMKGGEVQMVYPQPQLDLLRQIKDLEPDVANQVDFGLSFEHVDFNTRNAHLKNVEIRKAFALALDRADLVKATIGQFDNRAKPLNNRIFVNNQKQYEDTAPDEFNTKNVDEAKSLIESIGYTLGGDGIYVSPEGKKLTLEIMTTQNNPLRENTIDYMIDQLKAVGIEGKKFLNPDIFAGLEKPRSLESGGFDVALFAWVASPFVTGRISIYRSVEGDQQGQNYTHGGDPAVDQKLDELAQATDPNDAATIGNDIDTLLWDHMYTLPLYQRVNMMAFSSDYQGFQVNGTTEGPLWNSDQVALKQ